MKYVRDLAKADDKVMSVSPQQHKENRPFVGIIIVMDQHKYCIPLTSPKPKHSKMKNDLDFSKILDSDNKIIGALNLNNMIPVSKEVIRILDIRPDRRDSPKERAYKELLNNQLDWCNNNIESITKKATKLFWRRNCSLIKSNMNSLQSHLLLHFLASRENKFSLLCSKKNQINLTLRIRKENHHYDVKSSIQS